MLDPNFRRTVLFISRTNLMMARCVILNRPLDKYVSDLVSDTPPLTGGRRFFSGDWWEEIN